MIITNLPPATWKASRLRRLFVSNLLHSYYCFEYNFTVIVTLYFHKNFMGDDKPRKWLSAYNRVLCICNNIRVDQVNFLREKFGVLAYSQDRLVAA